jgi:hypothetical protein
LAGGMLRVGDGVPRVCGGIELTPPTRVK